MDKNKRGKYWAWYLAALLTGVFFACNTQRSPCMEPVSAQLNMHCYQHIDSNNTYIDTLLPNVNMGAIEIDSARYWYIGAKRSALFAIVLSPVMDTTHWIMQPDSAVAVWDTLQFVYKRNLKFVSNACGYIYTYTLQQVSATHHCIDSVAVNDPEITTKASSEHVKVFF
jgi:hypothetical protein